MLLAMWTKLREALVSVLPVAAIVCLLNLTPLVSFTWGELGVFMLCALFLVLGIALFNLGADLAMTPMGEQMGGGLSKSGKYGLLLLVCFVMGFLITVAEPDLTALAKQVAKVLNGTVLICTVGVGVGLFLVLSVLKIIFKKRLSSLLMCFYMLLFALAAIVLELGNGGYLPLAFDSGGVTTGPITVPFLMALGVGVAATLGGKDSSESSFGLVAMCSVGPILAVMALGLTVSGDMGYQIPDEYAMSGELLPYTLHTLGHVAKEVLLALGMIVACFFILQVVCLKLPRRKLMRIGFGILYTFVGLVIFLTAVNVGFMPIGYKMGMELAKNPGLLCLAGFILGLVVVLAEPAVHVLNKQVEEITDGGVSKRSMMLALSIGVGISIGLSMLRIVFGFSVLFYLVPGYFLSLGLSFFVPGMYTAIAFDSGGVASGPLTSTFILPFAVGACVMSAGGGVDLVMQNAFGIVAMVAMTPLITIQLLGFRAVVAKKVKAKLAVRRILDADDEQIIQFL